jgi:hypothetical protein
MFVIQADANPDDSATSLAVVSRSEALATARSWGERGKLGIRIIGDGRIYSAEEFAATIGQPDVLVRK